MTEQEQKAERPKKDESAAAHAATLIGPVASESSSDASAGDLGPSGTVTRGGADSQRAAVPASGAPPRSSSGLTPAEASSVRTIGKYVVTGELGRGGMGVVYRAFDSDQRVPVAIKMILDPGVAGEDRLRRFKREAEAAGRLRHPNVVSVLDSGEHEGKPFLVMDLIEGESLEAALRRGRMPPRRIAEIVRDIALALDHAHQKGVIHRDVKPENVLIDGQGKPHLADFGLARELEEGPERLTVTGTVIGTPSYMAPEQAGGDIHAQGPASDIYSLGAVLYRALVGRPPFTAATLSKLMKLVLFEEPLPPRKANAAIHPDLEEIVLRCLAKDPGARFATAAEVAEELRHFLDGEPITRGQLTPLERVLAWRRKHPYLSAALVLALVGSVVGGRRGLDELEAKRQAIAAEERRAVAAELTQRGFACFARDDKIGALDAFTAAIETEPRTPLALWGRGAVTRSLFDLDGSIADLTKAIECEPTRAIYWFERAESKREKNDQDGAIADYSRAIALDPKFAEAWLNRAWVRVMKKDDRADKDLFQVFKLIADHDDPRRQFADRLMRAIRFSGR